MLVGFAVPVISLVLGIGLSALCSFSLQDSIIISLLLPTATTVIEFKFITDCSIQELKSKIHNLESDVHNLGQLWNFTEQVRKQLHPYFMKRIRQEIDSFFEKNMELFNGTYVTSPHDIYTFGVDGISCTKENGCIKAVSSVDDYWEDDFAELYLKTQERLIKESKVTIQRVFVFPETKLKEREPLLKRQYKLGIDVYYIFSENRFVDSEWLTEDYLIQDDELLVEISCVSHTFNCTNNQTETITTNPTKVQRKILKFNKLLEHSTRFTL